jgi:hypothetical protein
MDQLMVLAEFDADADAVKTLTVTALKEPDRFDHLVAQLRRNRDDRVAYDAVATKITESGVPLVELENGWWLPEGAYWLSDIPAPSGAGTFTPAKHRTCPGHCADLIETDDGYELAYICLDPVGHGHIDPAAKQTSGGSSRIGSYGAMVGQRRNHDGSPWRCWQDDLVDVRRVESESLARRRCHSGRV